VSQERWDVVLRFLGGPLARQGDIVCRGPVVRLGADPGPGGLKLANYRGLDERQAVITAYAEGQTSLAPVGNAQVRLAPHEHVDWTEILPLEGPAYLEPGCAFHLGPPGRGATVHYVETRRLGVWEERAIISEAAAAGPVAGPAPSDVKELRTDTGRPAWFIPVMSTIAAGIAAGLGLLAVTILRPEVQRLGPVDEGMASYEFVELDAPIDPELLEGLNQPFHDFVMAQNAEAAKKPKLQNPANWDQRLLEFVTRSAELHLKAWAFWRTLDEKVDDYAYVVDRLRRAGLPEVFAAIPYQESRYDSKIWSPVCARGYWQFMPEVAQRVGVTVKNCSMPGGVSWTPTSPVPPAGVLKNAEYVSSEGTCKLTTCQVDERTELEAATAGAIETLGEAYEDPTLRGSGAVVQLVIASHNAGYDDARFSGRKKVYNVLPAYERWLEKTGLDTDPMFFGQQITCEDAAYDNSNPCGSMLHRETQHYSYNVLAQHMLAVCYYATNYGGRSEFRDWSAYTAEEAYCSRFQVPQADAVRERS